jgi:hypothetical protein
MNYALARTACIAIVCFMIASSPSMAANEFSELGLKTLFDIVKAIKARESSLIRALDKVKENVERALPNSLMDETALKQLEDDAIKLNKLVPQPLSAMNNKETIERIARGPKNRGTLIGASEELQRLERAGRSRAAEIERYKQLRADLRALRSKYEQTAQAARKLSDKIGELASKPTIEFFSRLTGRSVALSWVDFETELVPALQKRQEAAGRALVRLDEVITTAEKDLRGFNESRMYANAIFAEHVGSATGLSPSAVPGTSTVKLNEIRRAMDEDTKATMDLSTKMREEASQIRQWNAGISQYQAMLNWITIGLSGDSSNSGRDEAAKSRNTTINVRSTTILIRNGDNWELRSSTSSNTSSEPPKRQP